MSAAARTADPSWVHTSAWRSVASWIVLVAAAFLLHAGWTFWQESERAERDVRIVRESRQQWIKSEGVVHTQGEIVRLLRRQPYWKALPYVGLAALLGACAWLSLRRPLPGMAAALAVTLAGTLTAHGFATRLDPTLAAAHAVLVLILLVGLRSTVGFVRSRGRSPDLGA